MTGTPRKRGRPRNEVTSARRRADILGTAAHLFAQWGYPNTDMQKIANALQLAKGTLYRYFASKEDLFMSAVDDGMHRLMQAIDRSAVLVHDPLERIASMVRAYLAFFKENAHYVELLIQERAEFRDRKKSTYFIHRDVHQEKYVGMLQDLLDRGHFRSLPIPRIREVFSNLVYGTMFTNHFVRQNKPLEEQVEDILDVMMCGLLSDEERQRWKFRSAKDRSTDKTTADVATPISTPTITPPQEHGVSS